MTAFAVDKPTSLYRASIADIGDVSDSDLIEMMVAARRSVSRMQAVELAAVAELARRREAEDEVSGVGVVSAWDYLHDEVASALTLTAASADGLIRFATELTRRLPATFAALAAGELDYARARTVWQAAAQVDDQVAAQIEERLLPRAVEQTTGQIRAKIRRLVERLDPDALARRREHAERGRDVQLVPTDDGTAHLSGLDLPADAATAAHNRVNAIAAGLKTDGDRRGIAQLRADVFLALLSGTLTTTEPPADPTRHQIAPAPARPEDDWTGIDDAIADAIAHVARDQLTRLRGQPHVHRVRAHPAQGAEGGDPPAGRGGRPDAGPGESFAEYLGLGEPLPHGTLDRFVGLRGASAGSTVGCRAPAETAELATYGAHEQLVRDDEPHESVLLYRGLGEIIAQAAGDRPVAHPDQRTEHAPPEHALPEHALPERHEGLAELIAQAGERITDALAALKTPWCAPVPTAHSRQADQSRLGGLRGLATQTVKRPSTTPPDQRTEERVGQQDPHGHDGYRVPARMRRLIEARDRRCGFPGCRRPVRHCDADHTLPYHRGGPTCTCNLATLCRHHHTLKQTPGWRLHQLWPGVLLWITPTGHWRITTPPDRE